MRGVCEMAVRWIEHGNKWLSSVHASVAVFEGLVSHRWTSEMWCMCRLRRQPNRSQEVLHSMNVLFVATGMTRFEIPMVAIQSNHGASVSLHWRVRICMLPSESESFLLALEIRGLSLCAQHASAATDQFKYCAASLGAGYASSTH